MLPHIGTTCLFTFTKPFSSLDGVYNTLTLMTFDTAIKNGVDFVAKLYTPAGLSQDDYINDYASYQGTDVVAISPVADSSITYYVPEPVIALMPDPTVQKYSQIYLAIMIGAFRDPNTYSWVKGQIDDIISSVTGNTNQSKFMARTESDVYLTNAQYETLDAARQANIKKIQPLTTQLQNSLDTITALQSRIAALEQKIIDLS